MWFDYENFQKPLLPVHRFIGRVIINGVVVAIFIAISLGIGMAGYAHFEHMTIIDAFLNASMILGGMGPVDHLVSENGKIFAGCYAIYSGIFVIFAATLLLAPIAHRIFHSFHLAEDDDTLDK